MKHRIPHVLYFSTNQDRTTRFWDKISLYQLNYRENGLFLGIKPTTGFYNNAADLSLLLQRYQDDMQSLHVIVDLASFPSNCDSANGEKKFPVEYIRDSIISYPEVQFLFDKYGEIQNEDALVKYLFADQVKVRDEYKGQFPTSFWGQVTKKLYADFVLFDWESSANAIELKKVFYRMIAGRDNTFDVSNLRYIIKCWKGISLKVDSRNYSLIQDSRSEHLIICVEEEANQNIFNSYALYKNGYRVLPITSASELSYINQNYSRIPQESRREILIFRDFDLQFEDEGEQVNLIRGYKYFDNEEYEKLKPVQKKVISAGWNDFRARDHFGRNNDYWDKLQSFKIFFITRGPSGSSLSTPTDDEQTTISADHFLLNLIGMQKPISGLYTPFHDFPPVRRRYEQTRQYDVLKTSRKDHNHSTPLDIYDMINIMLRRAEKYYENRKFRLAALVSGEAIEIMNGFHQRLLIKAHFINFRSENAIAMDVVGGDEYVLGKDTTFRIAMIRKEIERLFNGASDSKYANQSINVLNQIYNDCRTFCKEREHFGAEEAFISAMGHLNEGRLPHNLIGDFIKGGNDLFYSIRSSISSYTRVHVEKQIDKLKKDIIEIANSLFDNENDENKKKQYSRLIKKKWDIKVITNKIKLGHGDKEKLLWSSSNNEVATVDNGLVIPKKTGTAVIFAQNQDSLDCYPIRVNY